MKYIYHIENIKFESKLSNLCYGDNTAGKQMQYNCTSDMQGYKHEGHNKIRITGWFVSVFEGRLKFITIINNKKVRNNLTTVKRTDVSNLYFDISKDTYVGFSIEIDDVKESDSEKLDIYVVAGERRYLICKNGRETFNASLRQAGIKFENQLKVLKPINMKRLRIYLLKYGFRGMVEKYSDLSLSEYDKWFKRHKATDKELERQKRRKLSYFPRFGIIVKGREGHKKFYREMLKSVYCQTYDNFELYLANEMSHKNNGLECDYVCFLGQEDILEPDTLYEVASALQDKRYDVLYTDEDKFDETMTMYERPYFKPDFSPDLLRSYNYISNFFVVRREIFEKITHINSEYEWVEHYNRVLESVDIAHKVKHIPKVLYHCRKDIIQGEKNADKRLKECEEGRKAVQVHLDRNGYSGTVVTTDMLGVYRVKYDCVNNPLVSIIIANKDHTDELDKCITSITDKSIYQNYEIIIVENNSEDKATFSYYESIKKRNSNIRVIEWKGEFNYSAINNYGVKNAKGKYILLLNNDTEMISEYAMKDMLGICMRDDVGAVGARLYYEDETIQHAGVIIGFNDYAAHVFNGLSKEDCGYMLRAEVINNYSAVTAACLMTKKKLYDELGGLDENFKVACNDVDFCLKLRDKGYLIVYDAFSQWYHYESKSRGYEDTPEKKERFERELCQFRDRWKELLDAGDEYYNKNFQLKNLPFTLD